AGPVDAWRGLVRDRTPGRRLGRSGAEALGAGPRPGGARAGVGGSDVSRPANDTRGYTPLADVLTEAAALPAPQRTARLWEDQRRRWECGERPPVEAYLRGLPADVAEAALLDLVYGEFVLRWEAGEPAPVGEFVNRFPRHAGTI